MMNGFKAHIAKKYQRFQQELSAELRTMVRAKGGSIKVNYNDFKEICLDDDNNVIFKAMFSEYTLEEIISVVKHKMGAEFTKKHMSSVIATNVNDEKNPLLRIVPLPIKNMVMKAVFNSVGEKKSCLTLSNIGQVKLPDIMKDYVERFDFILGVQASSPYNCGMLSFGDTLYINFIRNTKNAELERHFYMTLRELGINPTVESNN